MAKNRRRNFTSPTNTDCLNQTSTNMDLHAGSECERAVTNNTVPEAPDGYDGYLTDGYRQFKFLAEGAEPVEVTPTTADPCDSGDTGGYHRFTLGDVFSGQTEKGQCTSPYSRKVTGGADGDGINGVIADREEQLLMTTGKPVILLRKQYNGPICVCKSTNRGRSRTKCVMCFGTNFVPGFIPYVNQKDVLGRIHVRFSPFREDTPHKEIGTFQEVTLECWTLSHPIVRKRDVLIVYNKDGTEEFRYEIKTVERNFLFGDTQGSQKFTIKRIDPTQTIYKYDPFRIPDLADISVDISGNSPERYRTMYEQLGDLDEQDGDFTNIVVEGAFSDGAFSGMFTEGYKAGYEINYKRILEFKIPLYAPDFNEDGTVDDGYGPIFRDTLGNVIRFSTPQQTADNIGINPLEVIAAEKKRYYLQGFVAGAKHGILDGENELRARGLL